jgi:hypothetical protein
MITNLRNSFPCRVGKILNCVDEVIEACSKQDREQFPFNLLLGEVDALAGFVRSEYDDLNAEADRRSSAYDLVLSLEHRFRLSIEFIAVNKIFESVEKRYERIDNVLPPRNYSLRELLGNLSIHQLGAGTVRRLESAVNCFDRKQYKSVLRDCGEAGEALFGLYSGQMSRFGCDDTPREQGIAHNCLRKWMSDPRNADKENLPFLPSGRLEWFLLSMFETLHHLRNAVSHPPEADDRLPKWQRQRRALFPETPECARLALNLVFQVAIELQTAMDHWEGPT